MSAKIGILDELRNILTRKEGLDEGVLTFSKKFKIGQLFSDSERKNQFMYANLYFR